MFMTSRTLSIPRQGGFTLLEVLIAIIILSLGLLGLAKLQTVGLAANNIAYQRSQASILAYEGVDMVYADREHGQNGCYNIALGADKPSKDDGCAHSPSGTLVSDWRLRIQDALGETAEGSISVTQTGLDRIIRVRVEWPRWTEGEGWGAPGEPFSVEVTSGI